MCVSARQHGATKDLRQNQGPVLRECSSLVGGLEINISSVMVTFAKCNAETLQPGGDG